ncbi:MAG: acyl-CoA dehydrogenase family protein [Myxococcota bacterium]|nr:acyl-CoA dehydrogenase family protein [Myxococcota bacterium]
MKTHEVFNQSSTLRDYNLYASNPSLSHCVHRFGGAWADDELVQFGGLVGGHEIMEHGRLANENPPVLKAFDAFGRRQNVVEYHPSYHALMATSMAHGLHAQPWTDTRSGAMVARAAKTYMMSQIEAGHGCPVTMTFASVPALQHSPSLAEAWLPKIKAHTYDARNIPIDQKTGCTVGMAMTEKQGGSDVRANTTRAFKQSDGTYSLVGHKWFCSAPMSDLFLTLAQEDVGLSCFVVPRWTPAGTPNSMDIQRLKTKVGNRSNASSEIEYNEAYALRLGEPGRGVRTIIDMVAHTRLDCVVASAGLMHFAVAQAIHHCRHRSTFGRRLVEHGLMANVLADMALEAEAATVMGLGLAQAYEAGQTEASAASFARIATAVGKYWVCKRVPAVAYEAMESFGGNGYVEDHPMGRLYREAPLNSIWEGSGNVICLDVLRAMAREPDTLEALRAKLLDSRGFDPAYDRLLTEIDTCLQTPDTLELRARWLVERLALGLQTAFLIQHGRPGIAEHFVQSRLGVGRSGCFGTLPSSIDAHAIIEQTFVSAPSGD